MKYREFGNTGMMVSEIGFGAWAIGGNKHGNSYGQTNDKVSLEAIYKALELGCNLFDTADVYGFGHSEELLGKVARTNRDRMIIATKVGGDFYSGIAQQRFTPDYVRFALDKSLDRLQTDYIDIYQLHNPPLKLIEQTGTYEVLKDLKRDGKIRAWGVSIFDPVEGLTAIKIGQPDCIQVAYNIFSPKASEELLPRARQVGCAIIAREPLANGFLTGKYRLDCRFEAGDIRHDWPAKYIAARVAAAEGLAPLIKGSTNTLSQLALKFILSNPAVSVVIPGIKTSEQAQENFLASNGPLSADDLAKILQLSNSHFGLS